MAGGLTPEQIQALMSGTKTKGQYVLRLNEFVASGEGGIAVAEQWPLDYGPTAEKKIDTVKQGFENAKNSKNAHADAEHVRVIKNDEQVFLVNLKAAGQVAPTEPATEEVTA